MRMLRVKSFLTRSPLHVIVREAKIMGSTVTHGALLIGDLGLMDLHSSSVISGPVSDLPEFLEKVEWMTPTFNQTLKFGGDSTLDLALNILLDQRLGQEVVVHGTLNLHGNQLDVLANDSRVDAIKGEMRYVNETLTGSLDAQFMGKSARIGLDTGPSGDLRIRMQAFASPQDYMPKAARAAFFWLEGHSAWNITMLLPGVSEQSKREHLTILASSDFRGIRVDLPTPLGKTIESSHPLEAKADVEFDGAVDLAIKYSDQARARLRITPEGTTSGIVHLGTAMPPPPENSELRITGHLSEVSVQDWIDWRKRHAGSSGIWPEISGLQVDHLQLYSLDVNDAEVSARFAKENDRFAVDAPVIRGIVDFPSGSGERVRGVFDWLHLSAEELEAMSEGGSSDFDPQDVPPIDLKFHSLHMGPYQLRDVSLAATPDKEQTIIDSLHIKSHEFSSDLSGHWALKNGKHLTLLRGTAHTDDLHETLNHWSIKNPLRKGVTDTEMALQWPGAPYDYAFKDLQGHISIKGRDGRIRNVAPELARVLALLNLEMIFNRLSLDFDDVVRGGFTYQTAEGKFDFQAGNLHTSEFRIIGPSAQFLIVGRIGVEQEDYDLRVVATPETSVLLPAVGIVGGPIGIAGAYLGSKVLEWLGLGLDDATAVTYRVTGSWSEPVIKEIDPSAGQESGQK